MPEGHLKILTVGFCTCLPPALGRGFQKKKNRPPARAQRLDPRVTVAVSQQIISKASDLSPA